jgi:hypothetical protein
MMATITGTSRQLESAVGLLGLCPPGHRAKSFCSEVNALDSLAPEGGEWVRAVTTGPKTGLEILVPGRQDKSDRTINPVIRSADLIVAPLFRARDLIVT